MTFNSLSILTVSKTLAITLLSSTILTSSGCAQSITPDTNAQEQTQEKTPQQTRLQNALTDLEQSGFDGVLAISINGQSPIYRGYGQSSVTGVPDQNTQFVVGSITKTITATMVMRLVEQQKVTLETKLIDVFTDVPADKSEITIHQLLTHSSGFVDAIGHDFEKLEKEQFLERAFSRPLEFNPGSEYAYSNVGYSILAAIMEKRSGMSYEMFLEELTLDAGLTDIGYANVFDNKRSMLSTKGADITMGSWGGERPYWNLIGNGGVIATPASLLAFRLKLAAGEIVSKESVKLMQTSHVREGDGAPSFYGYGMVVQDHPTLGKFYWHNGGNRTFNANWTDYRDKGYLIIASSRSQDIRADDAVMKITGALYGLKLQIQEKGDTDNGPQPDAQTINNVKSITDAFLTAIASPAKEDWKNLIETRGAKGFVALAPMEQHLSMFTQFHNALLGFEKKQLAMTGPDEIMVMMHNPNTGEEKQVIIGFENTQGGLLAGVGIDD